MPYYTSNCEDSSEIGQFGNHIALILHTPFLLVNSLRYFIYQVNFMAKYFNKVVHFHELLWAAFNSSHRHCNSSDCLPHPAEESRPLLLVRREFLETNKKNSGILTVKQTTVVQNQQKRDLIRKIKMVKTFPICLFVVSLKQMSFIGIVLSLSLKHILFQSTHLKCICVSLEHGSLQE